VPLSLLRRSHPSPALVHTSTLHTPTLAAAASDGADQHSTAADWGHTARQYHSVRFGSLMRVATLGQNVPFGFQGTRVAPAHQHVLKLR
jgi:hypothetical protein